MPSFIPFVSDSHYSTLPPRTNNERELWSLLIKITKCCKELIEVHREKVSELNIVEHEIVGNDTALIQPSHKSETIFDTSSVLELSEEPAPWEESELLSEELLLSSSSLLESKKANSLDWSNNIKVQTSMKNRIENSSRDVTCSTQQFVTNSLFKSNCHRESVSGILHTLESTSNYLLRSTHDKEVATDVYSSKNNNLEVYMRSLQEFVYFLSTEQIEIGASALDVAIQIPLCLLRLRAVKCILQHPYLNFDVCAPVVVAVNVNDPVIVELLLHDSRVDPNSGFPLVAAVQLHKISLLQILLAHSRINVNYGNAFYIAVKECNLPAVRVLIEHSELDANRTSQGEGDTPLIYVIRQVIKCRNHERYWLRLQEQTQSVPSSSQEFGNQTPYFADRIKINNHLGGKGNYSISSNINTAHNKFEKINLKQQINGNNRNYNREEVFKQPLRMCKERISPERTSSNRQWRALPISTTNTATTQVTQQNEQELEHQELTSKLSMKPMLLPLLEEQCEKVIANSSERMCNSCKYTRLPEEHRYDKYVDDSVVSTSADEWSKLLRLLLSNDKVDVNASLIFTPLQFAVMRGSNEIVQMLLSHALLEPNKIPKSSRTLACAFNNMLRSQEVSSSNNTDYNWHYHQEHEEQEEEWEEWEEERTYHHWQRQEKSNVPAWHKNLYENQRRTFGRTHSAQSLHRVTCTPLMLALQQRRLDLFELLLTDNRVATPITILNELESDIHDSFALTFIEVWATYVAQWEGWAWRCRRRALYIACIAMSLLTCVQLLLVIIHLASTRYTTNAESSSYTSTSVLGKAFYVMLMTNLIASVMTVISSCSQIRDKSHPRHMIRADDWQNNASIKFSVHHSLSGDKFNEYNTCPRERSNSNSIHTNTLVSDNDSNYRYHHRTNVNVSDRKNVNNSTNVTKSKQEFMKSTPRREDCTLTQFPSCSEPRENVVRRQAPWHASAITLMELTPLSSQRLQSLFKSYDVHDKTLLHNMRSAMRRAYGRYYKHFFKTQTDIDHLDELFFHYTESSKPRSTLVMFWIKWVLITLSPFIPFIEIWCVVRMSFLYLSRHVQLKGEEGQSPHKRSHQPEKLSKLEITKNRNKYLQENSSLREIEERPKNYTPNCVINVEPHSENHVVRETNTFVKHKEQPCIVNDTNNIYISKCNECLSFHSMPLSEKAEVIKYDTWQKFDANKNKQNITRNLSAFSDSGRGKCCNNANLNVDNYPTMDIINETNSDDITISNNNTAIHTFQFDCKEDHNINKTDAVYAHGKKRRVSISSKQIPFIAHSSANNNTMFEAIEDKSALQQSGLAVSSRVCNENRQQEEQQQQENQEEQALVNNKNSIKSNNNNNNWRIPHLEVNMEELPPRENEHISCHLFKSFVKNILYEVPNLYLRRAVYLSYETIVPSRLFICVIAVFVHLVLLFPADHDKVKQTPHKSLLIAICTLCLACSIIAGGALLVSWLLLRNTTKLPMLVGKEGHLSYSYKNLEKGNKKNRNVRKKNADTSKAQVGQGAVESNANVEGVNIVDDNDDWQSCDEIDYEKNFYMTSGNLHHNNTSEECNYRERCNFTACSKLRHMPFEQYLM